VVSRVHGVRGVENGLTVNWVPRFHDAALAERIVERLGANWETRWVADSIRVQVHGGVATLTGDVNTWSERHEAGRLAYLTDGIWSVVNKVRVRNVEYPWELWEMGEPNPFGLYLPHPPVYYDRY
jgi:osmotically-inducible protein OsmY